jgi:hypothetical protein
LTSVVRKRKRPRTQGQPYGVNKSDLTDSFVGDSVVNLIPLGLINSLLFDDAFAPIFSFDCCSS